MSWNWLSLPNRFSGDMPKRMGFHIWGWVVGIYIDGVSVSSWSQWDESMLLQPCAFECCLHVHIWWTQCSNDVNQGGPTGDPQATYYICPSSAALSVRMRYCCHSSIIRSKSSGETLDDKCLWVHAQSHYGAMLKFAGAGFLTSFTAAVLLQIMGNTVQYCVNI
jgi:hypothetical protein